MSGDLDALAFYIGEAEQALTTRPRNRRGSLVTDGEGRDLLADRDSGAWSREERQHVTEYVDRLEAAIRGIATAFDAEVETEEEGETLERALADLTAEQEADYHDAVRSGASLRELAATERRHDRERHALRARFDVEPA